MGLLEVLETYLCINCSQRHLFQIRHLHPVRSSIQQTRMRPESFRHVKTLRLLLIVHEKDMTIPDLIRSIDEMKVRLKSFNLLLLNRPFHDDVLDVLRLHQFQLLGRVFVVLVHLVMFIFDHARVDHVVVELIGVLVEGPFVEQLQRFIFLVLVIGSPFVVRLLLEDSQMDAGYKKKP